MSYTYNTEGLGRALGVALDACETRTGQMLREEMGPFTCRLRRVSERVHTGVGVAIL